MQVGEKNDAMHLPIFGVSVLNYLSWKEQTQTLQLAAIGFGSFSLSSSGEPEQFTGSPITPSLLPVIGVSHSRRPRVHRRRGQTRRAARGDDQRRRLETAGRRRPWPGRQDAHLQRARLHRHRHRARGADGADQRRRLDAADDRFGQGDPPEPHDVRRCPAAAGRPVRSGAGGDEHHRGAGRGAVSGDEGLGRSARHFLQHVRQHAAADGAAGAARGGRVRAADRVRQHRQPAPGARGGAAEGHRDSHRARCKPRQAAAAAARREPDAVVRRRRARHPARDVGGRGDQSQPAAEPAAAA